MDCRTFFEELGQSYVDNGLDFPYSYEGFYFGDFGRAKAQPKSAHPHPPPNKKKYDLYSRLFDGKAVEYKWYSPPIDHKQKDRLFKNPTDMVYTLAWELSQRIGRLPAALHARMVIGGDDHPCVRRYIAEWGA